MMETRLRIGELVESEGLRFVGIVALDVSDSYARFEQWLSESRQAGMSYLQEYRDLRREPGKLVPNAKTALVVALPYSLGDPIECESPRVAQYARLTDYHHVLRKRGTRILARLPDTIGESVEGRVFVDSAPILEKALAAKGASGFLGKNTCFIHPQWGSFLLLAEIFVTCLLPLDEAPVIAMERKTKAGGCGPCDLCQVHCPTGALSKDYQIDSNRCLSYWTIEHRGTIPEEFWPHLSKYYFGCDICQLVCPYNHDLPRAALASDFKTRELPPLFETATMDQVAYEKFFGGTPMTRAKRNGLRRNALIAMTVTRDPRLDEALMAARADGGPPIGETLEQIDRYRHSRVVLPA